MARKQMKVNVGGRKVVDEKDQKPAKRKSKKVKPKTVKGGENGAN